MKLRKRIAAIGAAVMMATSVMSFNVIAAEKAVGYSKTISDIKNKKYEDWYTLKTVYYEETHARLGDVQALYEDGWFNDYVYGRTTNASYKHYSMVSTSVGTKTGPDKASGGTSTTPKCKLKGSKATFYGVFFVT